ncbi:uncharacterized protein LOC123720914 isoform X2 [Papilio machaon]|uniref:uncharacterized protein LOC123720914 isoform X2 n=1 Tax=Papilio machaon TaxID=76193 RepID=UPI001E6650B7|nr:uncharacterized protein LOC123720914 isoform X2 [Papilio machaon]
MTKSRTRRQSRRQSEFFDPAEDGSSPPPTTTGNMSVNDMAAMMSTWQRNQEETFERLLHTVLNHSQRPSSPPAQPAHGNFASCKARYSGAPDESLDGFIDAVEAYKECANVNETNALRGLSMLLTHEAATWWQGIKTTTNKWDHALTSLRGAFGDSRPPHRIYKELFANPQQANEKTELFIAKTRALLSRLPKDDLTTKVQMDMVYGLLHSKIRERLRREEIDTFDTLLRKSREIEESCDESLSTTGLQNKLRQRQFPPTSRHAASVTAAQGSTTAPPLAPQSAPKPPAPAAESSAHGTYRRPPRNSVVPHTPSSLQPHGSSTPFANAKRRYCFYCKSYGHTRDECRRLAAKGKQDIDNAADPIPSCYGCNERGVTRSQCAKCNSDFSACEYDRPKGALMGTYGTRYSTTVIKSSCDKDESQVSSISSYNSVSHKGFPSSMLPPPKSNFDSVNHKPSLVNNIAWECSENFLPTQFKSALPELFHTKNNHTEFLPKQFTSVLPELFYANIDHIEFLPIDFTAFLPYQYFLCDNGCVVNLSRDTNMFECMPHDAPPPTSKLTNMLGDCSISKCNLTTTKSISFSTPTDKNRVTMIFSGHPRNSNIEVRVTMKNVFYEQSGNINNLKNNFTTPTRLTMQDDCNNNQKLFPKVESQFLLNRATTCSNISLSTLDSTNSNAHPQVSDTCQSQRRPILGVEILGVRGTALLDTGAKGCIAGASLYQVLLRHNHACQETTKRVRLADGSVQIRELLVTNLHVKLKSKLLCLEFIIFPDTESNDTILGMDFIASAGMVLDFAASIWYFSGDEVTYPLEYELSRPCVSVSSADFLREEEGVMLHPEERLLLSDFLKQNEDLFEPGGGPTPYAEHHIDTGDNAPIAVPPYRLTPAKKEIMKAELEKMLADDVIEECESAWSAPALLVPKKDGSFRFCVDYRRLNAITKTDSYPIPLIDDLDDILVITQGSFQDHLQDLDKVFDRLRHFGLHANRAKCHFARQEVTYLGHVITPKGIKPDSTKVDAVLKMKEPHNLKHLKSFLQTCSWFRKFIPDFSRIAEPLSKLTRKNEAWTWGEAQQRAFDVLKSKLTSAPILIQADYTQPFLLRTDASNYALGAALLQGDNNNEKPIEYASRLLTSAERNYSTTEREALAVVWAVEKFRGYIDGHLCIVKSDHQPLKWLLTLKSPSGRLIRWALKLQAFDLKIEYSPGKVNTLADTLSRPTCNGINECEVCSVIVDLPQALPSQLRAEQLEDPEVAKIIQDLESTDELTSTRWLERGYVLQRGVLYRYDPDNDSEEAQMVVPISKREEILKSFHDSPTAGHQGIERTLQRIREHFFFIGMRRYVTEYLKNCVDCLKYKAANQKPAGLLQTPVLQQRSEVLAVDLFGPLPEGDQGQRWVLLVEDVATRWVELFSLVEATAENCAKLLIEEYFLRYGLPRRVVSDNGTQFISSVMQLSMFILGVKQELIPVYHPEANPAERKNRDLKVQLSLLVKNEHRNWPKYLAHVRFAMNSAVCSTTGKTPAFLTFARELRTPFEMHHDLRAILDKENFVPSATPYLRSFVRTLQDIRDRVEKKQDQRKEIGDTARRSVPTYKQNDLVLVKTHVLSNASKGKTRKFMPKRDGPYRVKRVITPTTFILSNLTDDDTVIGKYHSSDLTPFIQTSDNEQTTPVIPKKGRGRPRIKQSDTKLDPGRVTNLEGEPITQRSSERALKCHQRVLRNAPQPAVIGPRPRRHYVLPSRLRD